jgi:hypothetical protein
MQGKALGPSSMESVSDVDVRQARLDIADELDIASSTLEVVGFYEG